MAAKEYEKDFTQDIEEEVPVAGNGYNQGDQFDGGPSSQATTTIVDDYESDSDEVQPGKYPAIFQGAKRWERDGVVKLILDFKLTDGPSVNKDVSVWITEVPKPGGNPTPLGIFNAFQECLGFVKGPSASDPAKLVYKGNFVKSIGTPLYLEVVQKDGFTNYKPSKADEHARKCAERFV